jgi:hypothetical protein
VLEDRVTVIPIRDGDRAEPEPGSDSDTARSQTAEPLPDPDEIPAAPRADIPKRQQIVPEHLTRAQLPITLREWAGKTWYQARFHGFRSPAHLVMFIWYALRGAGKLTKRLFTWWHWTHGWIMESAGVAAGRSGTPEAMRVHVEGKKTRAARGKIVAACAVSFIVLLVAAIHCTTAGPKVSRSFPRRSCRPPTRSRPPRSSPAVSAPSASRKSTRPSKAAASIGYLTFTGTAKAGASRSTSRTVSQPK